MRSSSSWAAIARMAMRQFERGPHRPLGLLFDGVNVSLIPST
jgi:hypothetical protein